MDITLDDVLTILDEHYNNVKMLDVLNQELLQLQMANKETVLDWGICGRVEERSLLQQTSQVIKSNGSLPKGRATGKDILRLPKGCQGG